MADVVLPAATHFEFNDIGHYGLGHGFILARPKVVDPPAQCWPDIKILNELGKALTPGQYWYEDYEGLLDSLLAPAGMGFKQFAECGILRGTDQFKKYERDGFNTPSGKVELCLSQASKLKLPALPDFKALPDPENSEYPLVLTSAKSRNFLHSSYRWLEKLRNREPQPRALIHPQTASKHGIRDGSEIIIETPHGQVWQKALLSSDIHPQIVYAAYGWWHPEDTGDAQSNWKRSNFNMLTTTDNLGREFGTPNLKGISCRIRCS
jgi:anaerobic selenocysteine-containing dehydrogenase